MSTTFTFWTQKSTLKVAAEAVVPLESIAIYSGGPVCFAETEDLGNWVEQDLEKLAKVATAGKMIVVKEGEGGIRDGVFRFIVVPGEVRVQRADIWWEWAEDEERKFFGEE